MKKHRVIIIVVFTLSFISTFNVMYATYSKYNSKFQGQITTEVAVPIINDTISTLNVKFDDMKPGDVKRYNFSVTNFIDDVISETKLQYIIKLVTSDNIPVTLELYKNGDEVVLNNDLEAPVSYLIAGTSVTDEYSLVISWDITNNSYTYNGLTDYFDIVIESEQVID